MVVAAEIMPWVSVKIDSEVRRLAKIVAAYQDRDLGEYLSERLLPLVKEDLARHQAEASGEGRPEGGKRRKSKRDD